VWTTLITAVATVSASLGTVWIKGRFDPGASASKSTRWMTPGAVHDESLHCYGQEPMCVQANPG
jgi:hypothetical protein